MQREESPGEYAYRAILEAVRLGYPVYVKRLVRGAFLLRRPGGGKGVLFSSWLPGEEEGFDYVALSIEPVTVWKHKVAKVSSGGDLLELYPFNVAKAAGQYASLFTTHEADVWYRRLLAFWKRSYEEARSPPTVVRELARDVSSRLGCAPVVVHFVELGDYAVICRGLVVAWFNLFTGRTDRSEEFLRAAGLLG